MTPGQEHESKHFERVITSVRPAHRRPKWIAGDKGYSCSRIRDWCKRRGIRAVIPQRLDQLKHEGRRRLNRAVYRGRNIAERSISWIKENRRIATRYEKLATTFVAMIKLAFVRRYLRLLDPSDTP